LNLAEAPARIFSLALEGAGGQRCPRSNFGASDFYKFICSFTYFDFLLDNFRPNRRK
jgi:hypothetical protein